MIKNYDDINMKPPFGVIFFQADKQQIQEIACVKFVWFPWMKSTLRRFERRNLLFDVSCFAVGDIMA